ncbi:MazG family protein [Nakamurella multipartita]|uniref:MazG family protein n=1 Tax=Nakamurella multipartita (strain ATCC 700099 / DSM 44233 / CIP 104796 / JCM 9543 / NBRC 105858 / Y-104) TaxID=479431 RepID=C8XKR8_NAKMY|nr:MazG family protein [Nakamurella multipartita]ACV80725.1 MazG family protein [Nakamurella multipartita DSM 44233]
MTRPAAGSGAAPLLEAVAVMDRLRSPGGCPWDVEQTHASLVRYLLEECYELVEAVESGDRAAIREELGDVLLQVLFHARIAAETPRDQGGFDIDDVAGDLVAKLVRRHPHVFGSAPEQWTAADQQQRWDELKKTERGKSGVLDGVAFGQPAVALAAKLGARAATFGLDVPPVTGVAGPADGDSADGDPAGSAEVTAVAEELFRIAYAAGARGQDPESALRAVARTHAAALAAAQARADRG